MWKKHESMRFMNTKTLELLNVWLEELGKVYSTLEELNELEYSEGTQSKLEESHARMAVVVNALADYQDWYKGVEVQYNEEEDRENKLDKELAVVIAERDRLNIELDEIRADKKSLNAKLDEMRADKESLGAKLESVLADRDRLDDKLKVAIAEKERWRTDRNDLSYNLNIEKSKKDRLDAELEEMRADRDKLNDKLEEIRAGKESLNAELNEIRADKENLDKDLAVVRADKKDLNAKLEEIRADKESLNAKLESVIADRDKLRIKLAIVEADKDRLDTIKEFNSLSSEMLNLVKDNVKSIAASVKMKDKSSDNIRYIEGIDTNVLAEEYKNAGYKLTDEIVSKYNGKYGVTYHGLRNRLVTAGVWKDKKKKEEELQV